MTKPFHAVLAKRFPKPINKQQKQQTNKTK